MALIDFSSVTTPAAFFKASVSFATPVLSTESIYETVFKVSTTIAAFSGVFNVAALTESKRVLALFF